MISTVAGASSGSSASSTSRFSELSSEQFMRIIFTELQRQDPLQPNDSSKLLEQLSSIRSIQSDIELSTKLEKLVGENQLAAAGGLIGKRIIGLDENLIRISGTVVGVNKTRDGPVLRLDNGFRVPFSSVEQMLGEAPAPAAPPSAPDPTNSDPDGGGTTTPDDPADPADPTDPPPDDTDGQGDA